MVYIHIRYCGQQVFNYQPFITSTPDFSVNTGIINNSHPQWGFVIFSLESSWIGIRSRTGLLILTQLIQKNYFYPLCHWHWISFYPTCYSRKEHFIKIPTFHTLPVTEIENTHHASWEEDGGLRVSSWQPLSSSHYYNIPFSCIFRESNLNSHHSTHRGHVSCVHQVGCNVDLENNAFYSRTFQGFSRGWGDPCSSNLIFIIGM